MIRSVIINAVTFTGSNDLEKYMPGNKKAALEEKMWHDKALKDYDSSQANTLATAPCFLIGSKPT